jgi:cytoskeletal protein RodZ
MKSVGQVLRTARENKKFTVEDVYKFIRIHPRFINALEEGDYSVFSNKVHAKGFLKIYADLLGLDVDQTLAFWRREYETFFDKKQAKKSFSMKNLRPEKLAITSGFLLGAFSVVLVIGFFSYLFYQYKSYTGAPKLEVFAPQNSIIVSSDLLDVTGKTDTDSVVLINNQKVVLNIDGTFATSLKINEGANTLSILSVNRLGKETEVVRTVIFRPPAPSVLESTEATPPFRP